MKAIVATVNNVHLMNEIGGSFVCMFVYKNKNHVNQKIFNSTGYRQQWNFYIHPSYYLDHMTFKTNEGKACIMAQQKHFSYLFPFDLQNNIGAFF